MLRKSRLKPRGPKYAAKHARTLAAKRKRNAADARRKYGTQAFRDYLHDTPCLWCGVFGVEQAHFGKHPMGKKNDWTRTGPLCGVWGQDCHGRLDRRETRLPWFTDADRALLEHRLAQFQAQWQRHLTPTPHEEKIPE